MNILLTIPCELNEKLSRQADKEHRSRQAHIVYLLEKSFQEEQQNIGQKKLAKEAKR